MNKKKLLLAGILSLAIMTPFSVGLAKAVDFSAHGNTSNAIRNEMQTNRNENTGENESESNATFTTLDIQGEDTSEKVNTSEDLIPYDIADYRQEGIEGTSLSEAALENKLDNFIESGICPISSKASFSKSIGCLKAGGIDDERLEAMETSDEALMSFVDEYPAFSSKYMNDEEQSAFTEMVDTKLAAEDIFNNLLNSEAFQSSSGVGATATATLESSVLQAEYNHFMSNIPQNISPEKVMVEVLRTASGVGISEQGQELIKTLGENYTAQSQKEIERIVSLANTQEMQEIKTSIEETATEIKKIATEANQNETFADRVAKSVAGSPAVALAFGGAIAIGYMIKNGSFMGKDDVNRDSSD